MRQASRTRPPQNRMRSEQHVPPRTRGLRVHRGAERGVLHGVVRLHEEPERALLPDHDHRQPGAGDPQDKINQQTMRTEPRRAAFCISFLVMVVDGIKNFI